MMDVTVKSHQQETCQLCSLLPWAALSSFLNSRHLAALRFQVVGEALPHIPTYTNIWCRPESWQAERSEEVPGEIVLGQGPSATHRQCGRWRELAGIGRASGQTRVLPVAAWCLLLLPPYKGPWTLCEMTVAFITANS